MLFAFIDSKMHLRVNSSVGFMEVPNMSVVDSGYPNSKLRRGRLQGNGCIAPTLTANGNSQLIFIEYETL